MRVRKFLITDDDIKLSVKGINDALIEVGDAYYPEFHAICDSIPRSKQVHIDETSFQVKVKKFWLWAFRSAENDVLIIMVDSRGRDVVKEAMYEDFHCPAIVDGWKVYSYFPIILRCCAHLI